MKKLLCGLLCLLMLLGCASAEGYLYAAKGDNGLWGHIDEMGNWVIPPKFDSAGDLTGQLCVDSAGRPGGVREP